MDLTALDTAVIEQLGYTEEMYDEGEGEGYDELMGTLQDVCQGGANAGWTGFTYYKDTVEFFEANKKEIVALAKEMAEDMGTSAISLVRSFNCLCDKRRPKGIEPFMYGEDEIAEVLYGSNDESDSYTQIANALAWFALEETARKLTGE